MLMFSGSSPLASGSDRIAGRRGTSLPQHALLLAWGEEHENACNSNVLSVRPTVCMCATQKRPGVLV